MALDLKEARLHKWNDERGRWYTQEDLAQAVGCTRANIGLIETGRTKPSPKLPKRIGEVLGVDWQLFFE